MYKGPHLIPSQLVRFNSWCRGIQVRKFVLFECSSGFYFKFPSSISSSRTLGWVTRGKKTSRKVLVPCYTSGCGDVVLHFTPVYT